jgi:phage replication initiation protein
MLEEGKQARAQEEAPPASNTGAQTALIDWLGVTFPDGVMLDSIYELFGKDGWVTLPKGAMGYRKGLIRGNVRILFDGSKDMGIHIEASGKGCRELEGDGIVSDWPAFISGLIEANGSFSRLDVAIDDKAGYLDMDKVQGCIKAGCVVSRYRTARVNSKSSLKDGQEEGRTVYFGSPASDTMVRIYDKSAETGQEGHWIRVELQARRDRAEAMALLIGSNQSLEIIAGFLRGLVDFKVKGSNSQRRRWDTHGWWVAFLAGVEKLRLSVAPAVRSVEKSYAWCKRQVAPTLAMLLTAFGGDVGMLDELILDGQRRMRPWHRALLATQPATGNG